LMGRMKKCYFTARGDAFSSGEGCKKQESARVLDRDPAANRSVTFSRGRACVFPPPFSLALTLCSMLTEKQESHKPTETKYPTKHTCLWSKAQILGEPCHLILEGGQIL